MKTYSRFVKTPQNESVPKWHSTLLFQFYRGKIFWVMIHVAFPLSPAWDKRRNRWRLVSQLDHGAMDCALVMNRNFSALFASSSTKKDNLKK